MLTIIRTCFLERKTRLAPRFSLQKTRADNGQNRTRYVNNHSVTMSPGPRGPVDYGHT
jgi:hypothetical protein